MRIIPLFLTFITLISCSTDDNIEPSDANNISIEIIEENQQNYLGRTATLLRLKIVDRDLNPRNVTIRISQSDIPTEGALILSSGGFGFNFYGIGFQTNTTIDFALSNGLQVFEIKWEGEFGWGTDNSGIGYSSALRGYTEIVKWLKENRIENNETIICNGGSGGSMQIAYGLVNFELEEIIDYAILMAGPPTSDLDRAIFGNPSDIAYWPDGLGGFGITDYIMGWRENGDYCVDRVNNPPSFVLERLEEESIINSNTSKDFNYESVSLYFVNTDDVTNADQQGLLYYNEITSEKEWIFLANETSHNVGGIEAGATEIRGIINEILN